MTKNSKKEMNEIYIHYGHKEFDKSKFNEIENRELFVKPSGGLWASRIDSENGWKNWIEVQEFYLDKYRDDNYFKFKLKDDSRILKITNNDQLEKLPHIDLKKYNIDFEFTVWQMLDFEKLSKKYDAIEVLISEDSQLYWELYGWDCDSLLVFNKDCIEIVDESN